MTRAKDISKILTDADISGNIDVDGVTNLDVVDIDGALTQDGGAVFNEASADVDFRVESNANANMLFVNGGDNNVTMQSTSAGAATAPLVLHNASSNANTDVRMYLAPCTTAADRPVILSAKNNGSNVVDFGISTPNGGTPVQRVTVAGSDGTIDVETGNIFFSTAGKGIYLGVTSATATNLLDDYEEGAYDATVTCSGSGTITLHTGFNSASYTKVGNLVHVSGLLNVASVSSPVGIAIISLPFTSANLEERRADSAAVIYVTGVASNNIADFLATTNENTATLNLQLGDAVSPVNDSANQIQANTNMVFSITYRTA